MPGAVPPLAFFCITALARLPDQLHHFHPRRIPANPALLDALPYKPDLCLWAALAQLVHPLPPHLHDHDLPLSHPDLPLLQKIPQSPDFALVTLVSLPNCVHLRDDDIVNLRTLHCLLALDLRGCSISSYALIALTRGLATSSNNHTRTGPWGLRLLSLYGCPNIDNDVLSVLHKFPLLSAVDLRFTRCTPYAVNASLSSLGFGPSSNNSLFHPASLSLALYTLEKIAYTTSVPVSLYSCPSRSVFRLHIDQLNHPMSHSNKAVPVDSSSIPQTATRTMSSTEDIVISVPPLQGPAKDTPLSLSKSSETANAMSLPIARSTSSDPASNVSSFYENAPAQNRHILPLSAQAVQSSKGGKSDPLAIARSPPPWKILQTQNSPAPPKSDMVACTQNILSNNVENSRQKRSIFGGMGQALDNPLEVDRARLRKRGSDTVADMVHQFSNKRIKIESEFALAKRREALSVKPCNPFVKSIRSVFAESSTKCSDKPPALANEPPPKTGSGMQLRTCRSLPSKPGGTETTKPLRPITTYKPPILPKELLPSLPRAPRPRKKLKQTRLSFSREGEEEYSEEDVELD